jgi:hypothetical protein
MVEWHQPDKTPDDIQKIIREGRDKNDNTTFDSLYEYTQYIYNDNERILKDNGDYMKPSIDPSSIADLIREDRDERDAHLESIIMASIEENKPILDALGSDFDENGIPYWEKWDQDPSVIQRGYNYKDQQIEGRDNV